MNQQTYNGWANYATWRVNLELCEDEVENLQAERDIQFPDTYALSKHLEESVTSILEESGTGIAIDYAMAFIDNVNWYEIAEHAVADFPHLFESDDEDTDEDE